jgi:hypothetical protein
LQSIVGELASAHTLILILGLLWGQAYTTCAAKDLANSTALIFLPWVLWGHTPAARPLLPTHHSVVGRACARGLISAPVSVKDHKIVILGHILLETIVFCQEAYELFTGSIIAEFLRPDALSAKHLFE